MKTLKTLILALSLSLFSTPVMPKGFTKKEIASYNSMIISKMIQIVEPSLDKVKRNHIARALYQTAKKYAVDPKIMVAIISTESNFNNAAVSTSGDLSLAQINTKVWDLEFERLGLNKINTKLLKKDESYALNKMATILSILQKRHGKKDAKWYAIYHSKTKKYKEIYDVKVQSRLKMIASVSHVNF